jgi:hypothetical protein
VIHAGAFRDAAPDQFTIDAFTNSWGATLWLHCHAH